MLSPHSPRNPTHSVHAMYLATLTHKETHEHKVIKHALRVKREGHVIVAQLEGKVLPEYADLQQAAKASQLSLGVQHCMKQLKGMGRFHADTAGQNKRLKQKLQPKRLPV